VLFKLDENLGDRGQKRLQEAGHDVMTVREQQLCGRPDSQVIDVCVSEKRCLITLDTDFAGSSRREQILKSQYPPPRHCKKQKL
jgi:predicted nuclease of predicted toxin-antitoxin system